MTIRALFTAAAAALATLVAAPAFACTQETADRLSARTEAEWTQDVLRDYPVAGLYTLTQVSGEVHVFHLVLPLAGTAPPMFQSEPFLTIGCAHSGDWWAVDRALGEQVVVSGDLSPGNAFRPGLLYAPGSPQGAVLLAATASNAGPACLQDMAPFCVSGRYLPTVTLDYGYAAHLQGELKADAEVVDRLGVSVTRAFPHAGRPNGPRPEMRSVCRDDACIDVSAFCRPGGLECIWRREDAGDPSGRGAGYLLIKARSPEAMAEARAGLSVVVNGVPVSLAEPELAPLMRDR